MNNLRFVTVQSLLAIHIQHAVLQQQIAETQQKLVEAQQQIIALQQQVLDMTPKNAPDEDILWHVYSKGILSMNAANSDDVAEVRRFRDWNVRFAKKHIKPYVNPTVYSECVHQMTRGLPERIAELTTQKEMKGIANPPKQKKPTKPKSDERIVQLRLIKDA